MRMYNRMNRGMNRRYGYQGHGPHYGGQHFDGPHYNQEWKQGRFERRQNCQNWNNRTIIQRTELEMLQDTKENIENRIKYFQKNLERINKQITEEQKNKKEEKK
ncbi:MAG: hypothetical protein ACTSUV_00955 [Candidatus Ranarchaeia archaeon]